LYYTPHNKSTRVVVASRFNHSSVMLILSSFQIIRTSDVISVIPPVLQNIDVMYI
jgi:hypothetical protein